MRRGTGAETEVAVGALDQVTCVARFAEGVQPLFHLSNGLSATRARLKRAKFLLNMNEPQYERCKTGRLGGSRHRPDGARPLLPDTTTEMQIMIAGPRGATTATTGIRETRVISADPHHQAEFAAFLTITPLDDPRRRALRHRDPSLLVLSRPSSGRHHLILFRLPGTPAVNTKTCLRWIASAPRHLDRRYRHRLLPYLRFLLGSCARHLEAVRLPMGRGATASPDRLLVPAARPFQPALLLPHSDFDRTTTQGPLPRLTEIETVEGASMSSLNARLPQSSRPALWTGRIGRSIPMLRHQEACRLSHRDRQAACLGRSARLLSIRT